MRPPSGVGETESGGRAPADALAPATSQMVLKAAATTSASVAAAELKTAGTEVVPQLWSLSVWTVGEAFCPNCDLPSAMVTAVANPASPYAPTTTEAPDPEIAPELCAVPELQAAADPAVVSGVENSARVRLAWNQPPVPARVAVTVSDPALAAWDTQTSTSTSQTGSAPAAAL